jgi:CRP-like cAMP-binding protein
VLDNAIQTGVEAPHEGAPRRVGNRLIEALAPPDRALMLRHARCETLVAGQILLEPGQPAREVLFPGAGTVLAMLAVLPEKRPVETALIGCEGLAGALFSPHSGDLGMRIQVITTGEVLRMPAERFAEALDAWPTLRAQRDVYAAALLRQVQVGLACAALHPVEARAARWMLSLQDRLGDRGLPLTQEGLADLLGVRRTTITRVVAALEARGVVRHRRGRVLVTDRAGLERASCACHRLGQPRLIAAAASDRPPEPMGAAAE